MWLFSLIYYLFVFVLIYYGSFFLLHFAFGTNKRIQNKPLFICGHRGWGRHTNEGCAENTMRAFKKAQENGVKSVELDLQRSKDGVLIISHDTTLKRRTGQDGSLNDFTFEELRKFDAGEGEKIPAFNELTTFAKQTNEHLVLELKAPAKYPGIEEEALKELEKQGLMNNVMIESFDFNSLSIVHKLRPQFKELGALFFAPHQYLKCPDYCDYIVPMAECLIICPWILFDAHRRGKKLYIWFAFWERTIIRPLIWLGVDGVIADWPTELDELKRQK